jgi:hypothetical protein
LYGRFHAVLPGYGWSYKVQKPALLLRLLSTALSMVFRHGSAVSDGCLCLVALEFEDALF